MDREPQYRQALRDNKCAEVKKSELPEKICVACGRPFAWRRKWAKTWHEVKYCSDACRSGRRAAALKTLNE